MTGLYTVQDIYDLGLRWPGPGSIYTASVARMLGWPPPSTGAPWNYVLSCGLWAEELSRREWLEDVRSRLGLVTIDGGMPRQRRDPRDGGYVSFLAAGGRKGGRLSLSRLIVNAELAAGKHVHLAGLDGLWCGSATDIGPLWEKVKR